MLKRLQLTNAPNLSIGTRSRKGKEWVRGCLNWAGGAAGATGLGAVTLHTALGAG